MGGRPGIPMLPPLRQTNPTFYEETPHGVVIDFVFDWKPELEQMTRVVYSQVRRLPDLAEYHHRFGNLSIASRLDVPLLQAADLLACECYKHVTNELVGSPRPERKSLARLRARIVHSALLPAAFLEKLGFELDQYHALLDAAGVPRSRIKTL
jgi:hypothetical protein